ncbi:unnamed protein product [Schistocephalus solidus]|uniref:Ovule protein n=1 Tax=Schistocephalus solidus TaxID=70667 RepID=A0A183SN22_SCHSO|nr:unnamed protein product [Schistocephalus solidus]
MPSSEFYSPPPLGVAYDWLKLGNKRRHQHQLLFFFLANLLLISVIIITIKRRMDSLAIIVGRNQHTFRDSTATGSNALPPPLLKP